jgi:hypothetical protein
LAKLDGNEKMRIWNLSLAMDCWVIILFRWHMRSDYMNYLFLITFIIYIVKNNYLYMPFKYPPNTRVIVDWTQYCFCSKTSPSPSEVADGGWAGCVRFQVLTAASTKITAFWDTEPCSPVEVDRRFRDAYCLQIYSSPWWWRQYSAAKRWRTSMRLHGAVSQKAVIFSRLLFGGCWVQECSPWTELLGRVVGTELCGV